MKTVVSIALALLLLVSGSLQPWAQPGAADGLTYKTGYSLMMRLGKDLHDRLQPQSQEMISSQPISIETDVAPLVRLLYYPDEPKPIRGVWISAGFIDLVNHVAHAKAIDTIEKGYFNRYIMLLSEETGEKSLRPLPNDSNPKYWSDNMLDEQQSNFNSIVGLVVAVKLAHHYLGQYDKYKAQLEDAQGRPVPINALITPREWDDAFTRGLKNALDAGCTIEGVVPFLEAFDKMKARPPWADYFLPKFANVPKMRKEMERAQRRFFAGEE